jgi:hypothetical protein
MISPLLGLPSTQPQSTGGLAHDMPEAPLPIGDLWFHKFRGRQPAWNIPPDDNSAAAPIAIP